MFNNVLHRNRTDADTATAASDERVIDERDRNERIVDDEPTQRTMRRRSWFGDRATERTAAPATAVEDRTVTDDRTVAGDRTVVADRTVAGDRTVVERPVVERPVVDRPVAEDERVAEVERRPWAHSSAAAICGLVIGVLALAATFTGLLAPLGVAVGVIGALFSVGGLVTASRRGVTGHSAAFVGLVASMAAIILGVLAIQGELSWLNSNTDEVAKLHTWLNDNFSWMKRW
jgi:hypothetical protein